MFVVYGNGCGAVYEEEELKFGGVRNLWQIPFWVWLGEGAGEKITMAETDDIHSFVSLLKKYKKQRLLAAVGPNGLMPLIF